MIDEIDDSAPDKPARQAKTLQALSVDGIRHTLGILAGYIADTHLCLDRPGLSALGQRALLHHLSRLEQIAATARAELARRATVCTELENTSMDNASSNTDAGWTLYCAPGGCSDTPSGSILLFLDFDGVLHPTGAEAEHFVHLPRLERVLRESPGARVVISSSWQDAYPLAALKGFFSADIAARIVGATRTADRDGEVESRYDQIRLYLRRVRHSSIAWVALDDAAHEFPEGCEQLVLCESARGFDDEAERRLRTALGLITKRTSEG